MIKVLVRVCHSSCSFPGQCSGIETAGVRNRNSILFEENKLNIFVGNLSFNSTSESLEAAFAQFGSVESAQVIMDRQTGRSRGFGFVEMPDSGEAQAAISAMNGADLDGRPLTVNEARPRPPRNDRRW